MKNTQVSLFLAAAMVLFQIVPALAIQPPVLQIQPAPAMEYLQTAVKTNHQGEHEITQCRVTVGENGLRIVFPSNPAYHLNIVIDAINRTGFAADVYWKPVSNVKVVNHIASQKLTLEKEANEYAVGDLLRGTVDITFLTHWVATGEQETYYVKGAFSALVRPEGFDPLSDENIQTYTPAIAVYELDSEFGGYLEGDVLLSIDNDKTVVEKDTYEPFITYSPKYYEALEVVRSIFFTKHAQPTGSIVREMRWSIDPLLEDNKHLAMWFKRVGEEWVQLGFLWWGVEE